VVKVKELVVKLINATLFTGENLKTLSGNKTKRLHPCSPDPMKKLYLMN